jgi:basic amino acid/polyamine antiporter, APA family
LGVAFERPGRVNTPVMSDSSPRLSGGGFEAAVDLPRRVGFWGAIAVMVGVVIGSGIFATPPYVAQQVGNPWTILALWVVGGTIALCGALTFAELATMMPHSGGVYVFLREGFGRCPAFVFGWTYLLITKPAAAGGIAIVFAEHFNRLTGLQVHPPTLTCGVLFVLTVINVLGVRGTARLAVVLTALKYVAISLIIGLGVMVAIRQSVDGVAAGGFVSEPTGVPLWKALVPVMAAIMWTYDGWADVGSIAGEVTQPQRTLPRVFLFGTLSVIALYVLANAVYLWHIPISEMAATDTVAPLLLSKLAGPVGAAAVTVLILLSTLGSSHASVMTGARVTFAQARDGLLFRSLGRVHPRFHTPAVSLWTQFVLSCVAVTMLGTFAKMAENFVFTMWIFYGLAAAGLLVLRWRSPERSRPFRVPGYPVVPLVFVFASAFMTVLGIRDNPATNLKSLAVLLAGVPVYFVWNWLVRK